jgi:hypothetical protein
LPQLKAIDAAAQALNIDCTLDREPMPPSLMDADGTIVSTGKRLRSTAP